jgi:hypothetical protein
MRQQPVSAEEERHRGEQHLRPEEEPPPVDGVCDRTADERHHEERPKRAEREQADGERRVREVVELDRNGDERDLAADERDRLAGPETAEGRRLAERSDVDRSSADQSAEARLAVGGELLDGRFP